MREVKRGQDTPNTDTIPSILHTDTLEAPGTTENPVDAEINGNPMQGHLETVNLGMDSLRVKSTRIKRPVDCLTYTVMGNPIPYQALVAELESGQEEIEQTDPIRAFAASADPDTMYHHQAMREPDRVQFIRAMQDEVEHLSKNDIRELVKTSDMPKEVKKIPVVWAMKRKRRISTKGSL